MRGRMKRDDDDGMNKLSLPNRERERDFQKEREREEDLGMKY